MPSLAILKLPEFVKKEKFSELTKDLILKELEGKVSFREFKNTHDLYFINNVIFGKVGIEISNCYYDDQYLIQTFNADSDFDQFHEYIIVVKRKIFDNDTYTFTEYNPQDPSSDKYTYISVTEDDIVNILRKRNVYSAVLISEDGDVKNEEIIVLKDSPDVGKILSKNQEKEIVYLNVSNIVNANQKMTPEQLDDFLKEKINSYCADYFFIQVSLGFCILNCYYQSFANKKNETLSRLLGHDVFGDAIIFIQSATNDDNDTILHINKDFFQKLISLAFGGKKVKPQNKYFFNIYRELSIL
jgi:hypothetical protein